MSQNAIEKMQQTRKKLKNLEALGDQSCQLGVSIHQLIIGSYCEKETLPAVARL